MKLANALLVAAMAAIWACAARAADLKTFCNPLNLNYKIHKVKGEWSRHGADPVVVLYKDRYWLFSTWDVPGYRVSDDLAHWTYVPFADGTGLAGHVYTAAAVAQVGDWLYYTEFGKADKPVAMWRTKEPETGKWEKVTDLPPYADPCLFVDPPTGRVYMTYGLEKPIHGVELDRDTMREVPGTTTQLMPAYVPGTPVVNGWEVCTWDNNEASPGMRSRKTFYPCREGSWMTFHDGRYYLQYASPGTTVPGYADGVLVGKSPLGPFEYSNYSPISHKDSGFITSAGHSCPFQDRYGNWWRAVTMLIGVHERMERRIGLFPAGFDKDGIPYTRTERDVPITLPEGKRDQAGEVFVPWGILSEGKPVTASSELPGHETKLASDEDIRTWWSAKTGDAGEWVQVDLGKVEDVRAVQVNLAEQDYEETGGKDVHQFVVKASVDGNTWDTVLDERHNDVAVTHDYVQLDRPTRARFVRVENEYMPGGGKFAVSDLRVFGIGDGPKPTAVTGVRADRDAKDRRKIVVRWSPADGATGYLVRYGITKGKWYQHYRVRGGQARELTMYSLNAEPPYYFRVDAINENGVTEGTDVTEAP
jgi:hypothetical protein